MQVFVRALDDKIYTLEVNPSDTYNSIRDQILDKLGYNTQSCSIYCDGKYVDDESSLEELGMKPQTVLRCDSMLVGGAKKRKKKVYTTPKRIKHKRKKTKLAVLKRYTINKDGTVVGSLKVCGDCGPGVFMGKHKNRYYCGRCHDTEMRS